MAAPNRGTVSEAAARSIVGPTVGWSDASTSTTDEEIDLSAWAGRYVRIEVYTADHYICFTDTSGSAITTGVAATVGTVMVPWTIAAGDSIQCVVPTSATILVYRTTAATGGIRVSPA